MKAGRILVVDDDAGVRRTICRILEADGLHTEEVEGGKQAIEQLANSKFDLVLLDLMMNGVNGFDVIKSIRETDARIPIIVISAKTQENDKIFALAIGADDYITKPVSPYYVCAKVKATLRRNQLESSPEIVVEPFRYLLAEMRLFKSGEEIPLTAKESKMMLYFLGNPGKVCSKEELYRNVWDNEIVDNNTIMVCISNLRKKIEENADQPTYIETIRGLGYRFRDSKGDPCDKIKKPSLYAKRATG